MPVAALTPTNVAPAAAVEAPATAAVPPLPTTMAPPVAAAADHGVGSSDHFAYF